MWKEAAGDTIQIRVTPKAASNHIRAEEQADGTIVLRVYVTAVPEGGKANKAVISLLAKELGLPKSALSIGRGSTGRHKTVHIQR
jgi:uncharacterized protein